MLSIAAVTDALPADQASEKTHFAADVLLGFEGVFTSVWQICVGFIKAEGNEKWQREKALILTGKQHVSHWASTPASPPLLFPSLGSEEDQASELWMHKQGKDVRLTHKVQSSPTSTKLKKKNLLSALLWRIRVSAGWKRFTTKSRRNLEFWGQYWDQWD